MKNDTKEIPLFLKQDRNEDEYMIGSTDFPALVDLRDVTFVVFFPPKGETKGTLVIKPRTPRKMFPET